MDEQPSRLRPSVVLVFFIIGGPSSVIRGHVVLGTVLWTILAIELAAMTVVVWRRTGLLCSTLGDAAGATVSALVAVALSVGYDVETVPFPLALTIISLGVAAGLLLAADSLHHPEAWRRWRAHAGRASLVDILTFRHVPDLRKRLPSR